MVRKDEPSLPQTDADDDGNLKRNLVAGLAFGIGSAAIVAALLYATRNKTKRRD
ncbi:MAG: hypothetical protein ACM3YM_04310 [Sphingomonadales bacterium]